MSFASFHILYFMACRGGDWRIVKLYEEGSRLRDDCAKLNSLGFLFVSLGLAEA